MNSIEIFEFALRSAFASPINIAFSVAAAVFGYFIVVGAKYIINKKWPGGKVCAIIAAIFCAVCTLTYIGLLSGESYIQLRKMQIKGMLDNDIVWRNEALARTWEIIATDDNQDGVTPITEGGTMIKLTSIADAQIYAQEAAQVLESKLHENYPSFGNVNYQSKEDIAVIVMAANQNSEIKVVSPEAPYELNQDNSIANQVLDLRIDERFTTEAENVVTNKYKAMQATTWIFTFAIAIMSIIAGYGGWKDLLSTK